MKKTLFAAVMCMAVSGAMAEDFAHRITAEVQTAGPQSLDAVTWQQGTTPLLQIEPLQSGRPLLADTGTVVRMVIGPTATGVYYAAATNYAAVSNFYLVQWPTVGTNSHGTNAAAQAWWFTIYFEKNGHRYWTGSGNLYIEATTSTATNGLVWQTFTDNSVAWSGVVGDPASSTSLVAYVADRVNASVAYSNITEAASSSTSLVAYVVSQTAHRLESNVWAASAASKISSANTSQWSDAYSWGDHGTAGYANAAAQASTNAAFNVAITSKLDASLWTLADSTTNYTKRTEQTATNAALQAAINALVVSAGWTQAVIQGETVFISTSNTTRQLYLTVAGISAKADSNVVWAAFLPNSTYQIYTGATATALSGKLDAASYSNSAVVTDRVSLASFNVHPAVTDRVSLASYTAANAIQTNDISALKTNVSARLASNLWAAADSTTNNTPRTTYGAATAALWAADSTRLASSVWASVRSGDTQRLFSAETSIAARVTTSTFTSYQASVASAQSLLLQSSVWLSARATDTGVVANLAASDALKLGSSVWLSARATDTGRIYSVETGVAARVPTSTYAAYTAAVAVADYATNYQNRVQQGTNNVAMQARLTGVETGKFSITAGGDQILQGDLWAPTILVYKIYIDGEVDFDTDLGGQIRYDGEPRMSLSSNILHGNWTGSNIPTRVQFVNSTNDLHRAITNRAPYADYRATSNALDVLNSNAVLRTGGVAYGTHTFGQLIATNSLIVATTNSGLGAELVTDGTFSASPLPWTLSACYTNNGQLVTDAGLTGTFAPSSAVAAVAGASYQVAFSNTTTGAGVITLVFGGVTNSITLPCEQKTVMVVARTTEGFSGSVNATALCAIDGVSIKRIGRGSGSVAGDWSVGSNLLFDTVFDQSWAYWTNMFLHAAKQRVAPSNVVYVSADTSSNAPFSSGWTNNLHAAIGMCPEGGAIFIAPGVYQVTSGLSVAKRITISGAGRNSTFLSGGGEGSDYRCFTFTNSGYNAEVNDLSITNFRAVKGGAGAWYGTFNRCAFLNNSSVWSYVVADSGQGGAANYATLNDCLVAGNYAQSGGGGLRSCLANRCTVSNNWTASTGGGMYGGYANFSTIQNNTGVTGAGGGDRVEFYNCTILDNLHTGGSNNGTNLWDCWIDECRVMQPKASLNTVRIKNSVIDGVLWFDGTNNSQNTGGGATGVVVNASVTQAAFNATTRQFTLDVAAGSSGATGSIISLTFGGSNYTAGTPSLQIVGGGVSTGYDGSAATFTFPVAATGTPLYAYTETDTQAIARLNIASNGLQSQVTTAQATGVAAHARADVAYTAAAAPNGEAVTNVPASWITATNMYLGTINTNATTTNYYWYVLVGTNKYGHVIPVAP